MKQFIYKPANELAHLIQQGKAKSVDIVREHLAHIREHNDKIHALISIFEEEAIQEASKCDQEAEEGKFRGPLHGVPVTIKEQFWIKGKNSNTNFKMLKDFVAPEDAVIVDRIRKSGGILLGHTNVPKNLMDYQVNGDMYPEGKNPFNTEYSPGGSTGGGAAALAAGFSPLELGGDFGGSIRVPANFCGLYGLKPTEKTVPLHGNVPLPENSKTFLIHMVQAGPLARNVEDLELLWKILVGPHASDRNIPDIKWQEPDKKTLNQYKVAWTDQWPGYETSSQIRSNIALVVDELKKQGCKIENKIPDDTIHKDSLKTWTGLLPYIIAQGTPAIVRILMKMQLMNNLLKDAKKDMPEMIKPLDKGFRMNANHYAEMLYQRSLIIHRWESFFEEYDFLICPIAFGPAFKRCKIGSRISYDGKEMPYIRYVWPYVACFNLSGNPAVSLPTGIGEEGLPVGVQIVSKYWSEPELLSFTKKVADLTNGFIKPEGY